MELGILLNQVSESVRVKTEYARTQIKNCPDGTLSVEIHKGKPYYILSYYENGKRVRKGINRDKELLSAIIRREYYEQEIASLYSEAKVLEICKSNLKEFDAANQVNKIIESFPCLSETYILESIGLKPAENGITDWGNSKYEKSDYKPEGLKQITSRGLRVRSKSEVLIAEKFYQFNVPFRYEEVIHYGCKQIVPDFTIKRSDGKLFYWEHQGLTNRENYLLWQNEKAKIYTNLNIVPWDNLIISYDNADGIIDLRIVESEIRNKLMV